MGSVATALKILFVHRKIAASFLDKMGEGIGALKCGMPWENDVTVTPLPEPEKPEYLSGLVHDAQKLGAGVINAGGGTSVRSFFYPALLYPVTPEMRLYHEEQFGSGHSGGPL